MNANELNDIIESAFAEARAKIEVEYADSLDDQTIAMDGIDAMATCMYTAIAARAAQPRQEGCCIDLGKIKDDVQYSTRGLARALGKSAETVRRWSNDPKHPLVAHYRRNGAHRKFFIGSEVRRAMGACLA